jgi:hypothetical protein
MKNRHRVKLGYELVAQLSSAMPSLYFEMYTFSEPPDLLVDLYIFGMVAKSVPVGGRFSGTLYSSLTGYHCVFRQRLVRGRCPVLPGGVGFLGRDARGRRRGGVADPLTPCCYSGTFTVCTRLRQDFVFHRCKLCD